MLIQSLLHPSDDTAVPYVMAISAASFLYISLADLSPELHRKVEISYAVRQFLLILAWVGTIVLVLNFLQ